MKECIFISREQLRKHSSKCNYPACSSSSPRSFDFLVPERETTRGLWVKKGWRRLLPAWCIVEAYRSRKFELRKTLKKHNFWLTFITHNGVLMTKVELLLCLASSFAINAGHDSVGRPSSLSNRGREWPLGLLEPSRDWSVIRPHQCQS